MHDLAQKIGVYISEGIERPESAVIIIYGAELFLGAFLQFAIILGLAYVFKILIPVIVVLFSSVIFRIFSGGAHCTGYNRCLTLALLVYLPLGYFTKELVNYKYCYEFISLGTLLILLVTLKWAPAENPKHPIKSRSKWHRMKFISLVLFTLYLFYFKIVLVSIITVGIFCGLLWQSFTITSAGKVAISGFDNSMIKIEKAITQRKGGI